MSSGIVVLGSLASVGYISGRLAKDFDSVKEDKLSKIKVVQLYSLLLGAAAWPSISILVLSKEWNEGKLMKSKIMWIVNLWVMAMFIFDTLLISHTPASDLDNASKQQHEIKNTFMSVVSSVFAFGVLLSTITKGERNRSSRAAKICITGLLLGLAFAIPVFDTEGDSIMTYSLLAVTKVACIFAVGVFMSGVALELGDYL